MSKYKVMKTALKDEGTLIAALKALGLPFDDHRAAPITFEDYYGVTMPQRASFFVGRGPIYKMPGLSESEKYNHYMGVAIVKDADGSFSLVLDETHGRSAASVFAERLNVAYNKIRVDAMLKAKGYTYTEEAQADGSLKLVAKARPVLV